MNLNGTLLNSEQDFGRSEHHVTIAKMIDKSSYRVRLKFVVALAVLFGTLLNPLHPAVGEVLDLKQAMSNVRALTEKDAYRDALALLTPYLSNPNNRNAEEDKLHRSFLRLGAFLNLQLGNFSESEGLLRQLYRSRGYRSTIREEEYAQVLTRDTFFLWNALMRQGQEGEALSLLEQEIIQAKNKNSECYLDFAEYLSGKVNEDWFLENQSFSRKNCQHFAAASKALRHFWIAQRFSIQKEHEMARKHLILFLDLSSKEDIIERGVAFRQLEIPIDNRFNFMKNSSKSDECLCALNGT